MGQCVSSQEEKLQMQLTQETDNIAFLEDNLSLNKTTIKQLLRIFNNIDLHENGTVEYDEFCTIARVETSVFLESLFGFFSSSATSLVLSLTFAEFALFTCFFLTLDRLGMAEFLYMVLTDEEYQFNRHLPKKELQSVEHIADNVKILFGNAWGRGSEGKRNISVGSMDKNHNGRISKKEFVNFLQENRSLLVPAIENQGDLQETLGLPVVTKIFWLSKTGLGNRILPNVVELRDDLHGIIRTERQRNPPNSNPDSNVVDLMV